MTRVFPVLAVAGMVLSFNEQENTMTQVKKTMTNLDNQILELTAEQLEDVSGGGRTNGDNPIVKAVVVAAKATFYQGMWYSSQGWKS